MKCNKSKYKVPNKITQEKHQVCIFAVIATRKGEASVLNIQKVLKIVPLSSESHLI